MSAVPKAKDLAGAAYAAARAKLIRGGYTAKPPAVVPKALCDMRPEEAETYKHPKHASQMTPSEYAAARKRIIAKA